MLLSLSIPQLSSPLWLCLSIFLLSVQQSQADELPLIGVHMHYWQSSWRTHPPAVVLKKMDANCVIAAMLSSIPD